MYVVVREHPFQAACQAAYQGILTTPAGYNIDAEVLQEVLHLYHSRQDTDRGIGMVRSLLGIFPNPFPITRREIETAASLLRAIPRLSARDAIHAAVA
jgi:predicted nucleic acid-binding protein